MSLKESYLILDYIDCDKTGFDAFCVVCPDCEHCQEFIPKSISFEVRGGKGKIFVFGNSAIISLKISFNDSIEEFIFDRIITELTRSPGSLIKPIKQAEEGYTISLFVEESMVRKKEDRQSIIDYLEEFPSTMREILSSGKITINEFIRQEAGKFRL
ncbi:MAG: hypothetical protein ACFFBD_20425 [Candidatus Hodarchaeota archaeon]